ncbi:hypothetical protein VTN96DRAFT_7590 [Rasamsonia emersonii]
MAAHHPSLSRISELSSAFDILTGLLGFSSKLPRTNDPSFREAFPGAWNPGSRCGMTSMPRDSPAALARWGSDSSLAPHAFLHRYGSRRMLLLTADMDLTHPGFAKFVADDVRLAVRISRPNCLMAAPHSPRNPESRRPSAQMRFDR